MYEECIYVPHACCNESCYVDFILCYFTTANSPTLSSSACTHFLSLSFLRSLFPPPPPLSLGIRQPLLTTLAGILYIIARVKWAQVIHLSNACALTHKGGGERESSAQVSTLALNTCLGALVFSRAMQLVIQSTVTRQAAVGANTSGLALWSLSFVSAPPLFWFPFVAPPFFDFRFSARISLFSSPHVEQCSVLLVTCCLKYAGAASTGLGVAGVI